MTISSVGYFVLNMAALFFGAIFLALVSASLEGREGGNLHIGTAILVTVLGSPLYLVWGWPSTFAILAILTLWTLIGGLLDRKNRDEAPEHAVTPDDDPEAFELASETHVVSDEPQHGHTTNACPEEIMETILTRCCVPWAISPSMSGVTLMHAETDVEPECTVVCGGGRLNKDGFMDSRRIEITFLECHYARTGPHVGRPSMEDIGYKVDSSYKGDINKYLKWRAREWKKTGICPDSRFYVARKSEWLSGLPDLYQNGFYHYVVSGRDGYVELIAKHYQWREWLWVDSHRESAPSRGPVVGNGEGIE